MSAVVAFAEGTIHTVYEFCMDGLSDSPELFTLLWTITTTFDIVIRVAIFHIVVLQYQEEFFELLSDVIPGYPFRINSWWPLTVAVGVCLILKAGLWCEATGIPRCGNYQQGK